jgi:hypothetical protein
MIPQIAHFLQLFKQSVVKIFGAFFVIIMIIFVSFTDMWSTADKMDPDGERKLIFDSGRDWDLY